jgi:hypothetical protein
MSAPLSIPDYRAPLLEPFRCVQCGRRYLLWQGSGARSRAESEASTIGAALVDVRENPFSYCGCGELLDLAASASAMVM